MPVNRKLGRAADQRTAILRNMTTAFVINGKVETTVARAKEVSAIVEKLISDAVKEKDNYTTKEINVSAAKIDGKGKKVLTTKTSKNGNKYEVVEREIKTKTVTIKPGKTYKTPDEALPEPTGPLIAEELHAPQDPDYPSPPYA